MAHTMMMMMTSLTRVRVHAHARRVSLDQSKEKASQQILRQAVELFKKYDSDGDGVLGYSEFFELMKELLHLQP